MWEMTGVTLPIEILKETNYSKFLERLEKYAEPIYNELDKLDLYMDYND